MSEILVAKKMGADGFERPVVIKRMLPHLARDVDLRTALVDEARVLARLRHPNVIRVEDFASDEGGVYLVLEHLRGASVSKVAAGLREQSRRMHPAVVLHTVSELCAALHAAHELCDETGASLALVHRDVSPHNVFFTIDGEVKLLDFGIARYANRFGLTRTGLAKGKLTYMAPEQLSDDDVDRRADVFAVGVILHELLTGRRLFARPDDARVIRALLYDRIPTPSEVTPDLRVPRAIEDACMRALSRDRDERFSSVRDLREILRTELPALDPGQDARDCVALLASTHADVPIPRALVSARAKETATLLDVSSVLACLPPATEKTPTHHAVVVVEEPSEVSEARPPSSGSDDPTRAARSTGSRSKMRRWIGASSSIVAWIAAAFLTVGSFVALAILAQSEEAAARTPEVAASPPADHVRFFIESTPSAADVVVRGRAVARTPCELQFERGGDEVSVSIDRAGYHTAVAALSTDADRTLYVELVRDQPE